MGGRISPIHTCFIHTELFQKAEEDAHCFALHCIALWWHCIACMPCTLLSYCTASHSVAVNSLALHRWSVLQHYAMLCNATPGYVAYMEWSDVALLVPAALSLGACIKCMHKSCISPPDPCLHIHHLQPTRFRPVTMQSRLRLIHQFPLALSQ